MSVSASKRERENEVGDSSFTDSTDVIQHLRCAMQSLKSELLKTTSHAAEEVSFIAGGAVTVELTPKPDTVASVVPKINRIGQQLIGCSIEIFVNSSSSSSSTDGSSSTTPQLATFDIVEAEAYVLGPRHNDTFTHADPQQAVFGTFYFHRMGPGKAYKGGSFKGMDVTVGPLHDLPITNNSNNTTGGKTAKSISGHHKHENVGAGADPNSAVEWSLPSPFYAGFLIRAVKDRQTGQLIEGPCLVVDAILAAANGAKNILALVEDTGRAFLRCDGTEKWTTTSEGGKKEAAESSAGKTKSAVEEEQRKRREGLVGMRLVKNTNTLPTTTTPSIKTVGDDSLSYLLYNRLSVPQHVLLAPRVGLIPRTIADLRYGGAFYRFINICPSGTDLAKKSCVHPLLINSVGGEGAAAEGAEVSSPSSPSSAPPPAKKGAKKDTTDKKKSSSASVSEIVYLSKVRAGIVAALLVQRKLSELSAASLISSMSSKTHNNALTSLPPPPLPSSASVTVDSYRLLTGVTPSVFSNISAAIDKVFQQQCRLLSSNNSSESAVVGNGSRVVGDSIVLGSSPSPSSTTTAVFDRVLGKDVKNAEVIAEVTALYGIYVADGLGLMM